MHIPRRSILSWCGALALALAFPPSATAQSDDPQVDPDSPAGTEYQLPIDGAREQAGGGTSSGKRGEAPLFGEGVESKTSGGSWGSAEKSRSGEKPGSASSARGTAKADELETATPKIVQTGASAPGGGGTSIAAIGAGAAGVLLIGGLAGLVWRRRIRP